jgi:hypothetical protein
MEDVFLQLACDKTLIHSFGFWQIFLHALHFRYMRHLNARHAMPSSTARIFMNN